MADLAAAHLARHGVAAEPIRVDESAGKRFTFFADPDGLPLELYERSRRSRDCIFVIGFPPARELPPERPAMPDAPSTHPSLLRRLRDLRDRDGWRLFVEAYAPAVYGFARRQGLQDADAADVTQDVLRGVVTAAGRFAYDPAAGSFRGWLFTLARRRVADFRRERVAAPVGADGGALEDVADPAGDDSDRWDDSVHTRLLAVALRQAEADVAPATWKAFEQTALRGQPAKAVAAELGVGVAAVYLARSRVLARLKDIARDLENPS